MIWVEIIAAVLLITNLFCFFLMRHDKRCAKKGKRRVPEKKLFLAAACFGAWGGVMAMLVFRHKTRHTSFRIFFPAMLVVQIAVVVFAAVKLL